ncbi:aldehyde dehydrogenase [Brevibacterium daeguense]|uniref:Aldehyde dehydrogenase n=1 Tax=Brevibacterium daeguense TaxID=909936 RepID=A0ABP8EIL2_9MICO|nr:aldehyde dehydrogenase [Brevibacterium daeguense]
MNTELNNRSRLFIGGEWTEPHTDTKIEVTEASTELVIGCAPLAHCADIDAAVGAARAALAGPWKRLTPTHRADLLDRFAAALTARAESTAELVSRENGMPISLSSTVNGYGAARMLSYYADLIRDSEVGEVRRASRGGRTIVRREPVGVVAAITPWNYPHPLAGMKIAPALAAGCTVVLKPAPETALDAFIFADAALEAGLPPGVLNVLPADREESAYLVQHPGVDKVAFTGSTRAGREIGEVCGRLLRPVTLELGGKSAAIVAEDADLDAFARNLLGVSLANNGQTCHASTRILAPRSRYDQVVEAVTETVRSYKLGDPLDPNTQIGPLVNAGAQSRVLTFIESGLSAGYSATTGGGTPNDLPAGWFVEPTVFVGVDNSAEIAQEEIFGPVLTITPYADTEDAIQIANDSKYGLGGTVWTADEDYGREVAQRIETGSIGVNHYALDVTAPFGGVKASGLGRELGPEGIEPYFNRKSIFFA